MPPSNVIELIDEKVPLMEIVDSTINDVFAGDYTHWKLLSSITKVLKILTEESKLEIDEYFKRLEPKLLKSAQSECSDSMVILAFMRINGLGVTKDYFKAIGFLDSAIELNNAVAMNNRGSMYRAGIGGAKDYPKAIDLYNKAIKLGNPTAMLNLSSQKSLDRYLHSNCSSQKTFDLFNTPHIMGALLNTIYNNQPPQLITLWLLKSIHEFQALDKPKFLYFKNPKLSRLLSQLRHSTPFIQNCIKTFDDINEDNLIELVESTRKWLDEGMACSDIDAFLTENNSPLVNIELNQSSMTLLS